jgi:hypothetical protein
MKMNPEKVWTCTTCEGDRFIDVVHSYPYRGRLGTQVDSREECPDCQGRGTVDEAPCVDCGRYVGRYDEHELVVDAGEIVVLCMRCADPDHPDPEDEACRAEYLCERDR